MTTITLQRIEQDGFGMHGALHMDGKQLCYTLEEPWRENMPKISCIPAGTYKCSPHDGFKFQDVWKIEGVPNRSAILIHTGNTLDDTEGCILVGLKSIKGGIAQSRAAMSILREVLPTHFDLEVKSPLTLT